MDTRRRGGGLRAMSDPRRLFTWWYDQQTHTACKVKVHWGVNIQVVPPVPSRRVRMVRAGGVVRRSFGEGKAMFLFCRSLFKSLQASRIEAWRGLVWCWRGFSLPLLLDQRLQCSSLLHQLIKEHFDIRISISCCCPRVVTPDKSLSDSVHHHGGPSIRHETRRSGSCVIGSRS